MEGIQEETEYNSRKEIGRREPKSYEEDCRAKSFKGGTGQSARTIERGNWSDVNEAIVSRTGESV
ncbi:hypothetical protein D3C80_1984770 [compost metagenome]